MSLESLGLYKGTVIVMRAQTILVYCLCAILMSSLNVYSEAVKGADSLKAVPWTELMQAAADGDTKTLRRILGKKAD